MVGVAVHSISDQFRIDADAAPAGMFQFFKDNDSRAFAEHESIAIFIERTAGFRRLIVPKRRALSTRQILRLPTA